MRVIFKNLTWFFPVKMNNTMAEETPKKVVELDKCFICKVEIKTKKDKILIFGKSRLNISSILKRAINFNAAVYSSCELFICRTGCYRLLEKFSRIERQFEEFRADLKKMFSEGERPRVKRLHTEDREELHSGVAKSLTFATSTPKKTPVPLPKIFQQCEMMEPSTIQVIPAVFDQTETDLEPTENTTKVTIVVEYQSKRITKELSGNFAKIGKALARGPLKRLAGAALADKKLGDEIIEKIAHMVTNECNSLCSRSKPSLLRKTGKEDLTNFSFKNICLEWKERAPIFYKVLMTCARRKLSDHVEWLPSVAMAGSVLLKQRNSHMSATASVLGVLMKSKAIEVGYTDNIGLIQFLIFFNITEIYFSVSSSCC